MFYHPFSEKFFKVYFHENKVKSLHSLLWKHISNIDSCLYDNTHPYSYDLRWPFTTHARSLLLEEKMSADGKPPHGRTRILTDSPGKRNGKEDLANYNKTRINIGHQHEHWMELKEALRVQSCRNVNISAIAHACVFVCLFDGV